MAGGSYFKGWASNLPSAGSQGNTSTSADVFVGHVLSVDYKGADAGKIRVRLVGYNKQTNDDDVKVVAYPADMSKIRYPLPGELVQMFVGFSNQTDKGKFALVYYYTSVISSNDSITFNSDPYVGQTLPSKQAAEFGSNAAYTPEYLHRFESKLKNFDAFFKKAPYQPSIANIGVGGRYVPPSTEERTRQQLSQPTRLQIIERSPLRPFEGDIILQGRFGSSIRLGSAGVPSLIDQAFGETNQWSEKGGKAGDAVIAINVNGTATAQPMTEDVNTSGSAVYVSCHPTIPIDMATSQLKSHTFLYNLGDIGMEDNDLTNFIETKPAPPVLAMNPAANGISLSNFTFAGNVDFNKLVKIVIDNFEGGYWSDIWFRNRELGRQMGWPYDSRYASSGETMFGIDRKNGGTLNTGPAGIKFWNMIDGANAANTWRWGHMGGNLREPLTQLVGEIMKPAYANKLQQVLSADQIAVVNSDPRLVIHFVYATWNGSGWFSKFANDFKKAFNSGVTNPNDLAAVAINSRTREGLNPGSSPNSLIAQGGQKMLGLFNSFAAGG